MLDLAALSVIAMLAGPPAPAMQSYYSARYVAYSNVSDSALIERVNRGALFFTNLKC